MVWKHKYMNVTIASVNWADSLLIIDFDKKIFWLLYR